MADATHATVASFQMDPDRLDEQREGLRRFIVPSVRSSPGFVAGTWTLDRSTFESVVLVTFDSVDNAEAFADNVKANAANQTAVGIELVSIRIVEVAATA